MTSWNRNNLHANLQHAFTSWVLHDLFITLKTVSRSREKSICQPSLKILHPLPKCCTLRWDPSIDPLVMIWHFEILAGMDRCPYRPPLPRRPRGGCSPDTGAKTATGNKLDPSTMVSDHKDSQSLVKSSRRHLKAECTTINLISQTNRI